MGGTRLREGPVDISSRVDLLTHPDRVFDAIVTALQQRDLLTGDPRPAAPPSTPPSSSSSTSAGSIT